MSGTRQAGTERTAMPPRGMCIGLPATQGVLRPSANPPLQGLVRSALGRRGKPVGRYVDFQLERSVRGLSRSHMLFAAWGMAATRLGSKWDNSKAHPKGVSSFVHTLKWDNSKIHPKGICLFVYNLKNMFLSSLAEQLLHCLISCRAPNQFLAPASLTHACG